MSNSQPFQVYLRIKPILDENVETLISEVDDTSLVINKQGKHSKQFSFDKIFSGNKNNQHIFADSLKHNLDYFIEGYNTSILAYGITGSGKSHTIFGNELDAGLSYLSLDYLIDKVILMKQQQATLEMSFYEVYNETIRDLLIPTPKPLVILTDNQKGAYIPGITAVQINNQNDAREAISKGNLNRSLAQTIYNVQSSRSHAIIQISLSYQMNNSTINPKLFIVDLAGSEKVYQDQKVKNQQEGSNINRSLLALSNCLAILSDKNRKNQHIPYRNSKLTRLLQDSLGGNTRTLMIACIQQHKGFYDEILNTLTYSSRATQIKRVVHKSLTQFGTQDDKTPSYAQVDEDLNSKQIYLTKVYNDIYANIEEYYEITQSLYELQSMIQQNQQQVEAIYEGSLQDDQLSLQDDKLYHQLIMQSKENQVIEQQLQHALKINLHQKQLQKSLLLQINEEQWRTGAYWRNKYNEAIQEIKTLKSETEQLNLQIQAKDSTIQQQQGVLDQIKSKNPSLYTTNNDSDASYPSSFASSTSTSQIKKKPSIPLLSPKAQNKNQLIDYMDRPRFANVSNLKYLLNSREKSPIFRMTRHSPMRSPLKAQASYRTLGASMSGENSKDMSSISLNNQKKRLNETQITTINLFGNQSLADNKENNN